MNPLSIIRINSYAIKDSLLNLHKVFLVAFIAIFSSVLFIEMLFYFVPSELGDMPLDYIKYYLPRLFFITLAILALSALLLKIDHIFYSTEERDQRNLASISQALFSFLLLLACCGGMVVLSWLFLEGVMTRVGGVLGLEEITEPLSSYNLLEFTSLPNSLQIGLGILFLLFLPLLLRLYYLIAATVLDDDSAMGAWNLLLRATQGRGLVLFVSILMQLVCLLPFVYIYLSVIDLQIFDRFWVLKGGIPLVYPLVIALVGSIGISLVMGMQIATIRFYLGLKDSSESMAFEVKAPETNSYQQADYREETQEELPTVSVRREDLEKNAVLPSLGLRSELIDETEEEFEEQKQSREEEEEGPPRFE